MNDKENTITVEKLISECKHWGIPHFQRGSVWTDDNISLLLESLYYDTPCGNIILWKNNDPKNGEPLIPVKEEKTRKDRIPPFDYLIIDGQQRTRNLYEALSNCSIHGTDDDISEDGQDQQDQNDETDVPYVWAINLTKAFPDGPFEPGTQARYEKLFAKIQDPLTVYNKWVANNSDKQRKLPPYPYQYNFLPLNLIPKTGSEEFFIHRCKDAQSPITDTKTIFIKTKQGADNINDITDDLNFVCTNVQKIYKRSFFKTIIGNDKSLTDIIHTFIRINSGGRPVQQEEKAFSRLVEMSEQTTTAIQNIFEKVHGKKDTTRDQYLKRIAERQFGFRLFIRCFILTANYHTGTATGTQSFSYSVIQGELLKKCSGDETQRMWELTQKIIIAAADLLKTELNFDTFSFLPDSRSLYPLMMLLIKYPAFIDVTTQQIQEKYKKTFAYILLTLLLGCGDSEGKTMSLVTLLRESSLDGIAMLRFLLNPDDEIKLPFDKHILKKSFEERFQKLKTTWKEITALAQNNDGKLTNCLKSANAMNNRYILLLYALERSKGAVDFSGAALPDCSYKTKYPDGLGKIRCSDDFNPERQHIVPYSVLHSSNDSGRKGRISNDTANNIGNLTYISRELNHYETGLGAEWLILSEKNEGHILSDVAINKYKAVKKAYENRNDVDASFKEWIQKRQEDIANAFAEWVKGFHNVDFEGLENDKISQSNAILSGDGPYTDNAFLPAVWSCESILPEIKKEISWLAFMPKIKLSKSGEKEILIYDRLKIDFSNVRDIQKWEDQKLKIINKNDELQQKNKKNIH